MKRLFCLLFFCMACLSAGAQWKWQNPMDAGFPVVQNQGWPDEIGYKYVRLPDRAEKEIRPAVRNLSRNSAGLAIHFYSNAPQIHRPLQSEWRIEYAAHAKYRCIRRRPVQYRQRREMGLLLRKLFFRRYHYIQLQKFRSGQLS